MVIAAGKAAPAMAAGAFARWPDRIDEALVITVAALAGSRDDRSPRPRRGPGRGAPHPRRAQRRRRGGGAPPGREARRRPTPGRADLGGASALLAAPPEGTTSQRSRPSSPRCSIGALPIRDVNLVRRHLSRIKGGRLARAAAPARVLTLLVSDVVGGAPHDVGSGPTVPDPTTVADARAVLERAGLPVPAGLGESLKPGEPGMRTRARVIADPPALARAVAEELARRGLRTDRRRARRRRRARGGGAPPRARRDARAGRGGGDRVRAHAGAPRLTRQGWSRGLGRARGAPAAPARRGAALRRQRRGGRHLGRRRSAGHGRGRDRIDAATIEAALATCDDAAVHLALGTHLPGGPTGHNLTDLHVLARLPA